MLKFYLRNKVKPNGTSSIKAGIGARMIATISGKNMYRYVLCGEAFLGQNSATEFFGLGQLQLINYK